MQVAIDTRTVDANHLLHVSAGRILCSLASAQVPHQGAAHALTARIRRWYGVRVFHARARLDVPTYETTNVQRQLDEVSPEFAGETIAFKTLETAATFIRTGTQLAAQGLALLQVLGGHRDGFLLCAITLSSQGAYWVSQLKAFQPARGAWRTFLRMISLLNLFSLSVGCYDDERGLRQDGRLETCCGRSFTQERGRRW